MTPQILSPNHERGYYIVWDTSSWRKERVSDLLNLVWRKSLTQSEAGVYTALWRSGYDVEPAASRSVM